MAVDTQTKRRSTIAVLPVPTGTISASARRHSTWNYAGFTSTPVSTNRYWTQVTATTAVWYSRPAASGSWVAAPASSGSWVSPGAMGQD